MRNRLAHQEALAQLGLLALKGTDNPTLMREAANHVSRALSVEYCEVLELLPHGDSFLLRSGTGWREGYVGHAVVGVNLDSQAGYTLISGEPVRLEDLRTETRFSSTPLLKEHGVRSGVTTIIYRQDRIYGVLGAHTSQPRTFDDHEASFLSGVAEILGAAMDRALSEEDVRIEAMERTEHAEAAERRFRFLAEANEVLSSSSDYAGALACTARLSVPALADWCFVDVVEEGEAGEIIHRLAIAHAEAAEAAEGPAKELQYHYPLNPGAPHGTPKVLRTGQPEVIAEVTDGVLQTIARDAEQLNVLRELEPKSYMCVPLRVRRQIIGSLGLVATRSDHGYEEEDLLVAEGLAYCAALTIDHMLGSFSETDTVSELVQVVREAQPVVVSGYKGNVPNLTPRQREVLELISYGRSVKEVKAELGISEATVRGHVRLVLQTLGAHSQLEAVARARELGLLSS